MFYQKITKASNQKEQIELRNIELEVLKDLQIVSRRLNEINTYININNDDFAKKKYIRKPKKNTNFIPNIKLIKIKKNYYIQPRKMIRINKRSRLISYYPPGFPPTPIGFKGYPYQYYMQFY